MLKRSQFLFKENHESTRHVGNFLIVLCSPNSLKRTRLGITATRRFGKAHQRNRFKRLVREAFRLSYDQLPQGLDLIVKPCTQALTATFHDIHHELLHLIP